MAEAETQNLPVRLAFRIGYLGSGFYGSQYQPDARTVEGEIRNAGIRAGLFPDPKSAHLGFSGRTDRGVHARCQVIVFTTPCPDRAIRALPGQLPPDIWVSGVCTTLPEAYSPRHHVISRTYRYILPGSVSDIAAMRSAASLFVGIHDFSCFARVEPGKPPTRIIYSLTVHTDGDGCWFEVTAQSFLWHMVRCIATVLLQASDGLISPDGISALLSGRCRHKVRPADPQGLILWRIDDHLTWNPLPPMQRTIRLHDQGAAHHLTMARVHSLLNPIEDR